MSRHDPAGAVRLVGEQAAAGYDAIKIYNQVGREELAPLVAEARKKGLLVIGRDARAPWTEMAAPRYSPAAIGLRYPPPPRRSL